MSRRVKRVIFSHEFIKSGEMTLSNTIRMFECLPKDSKIVGFGTDMMIAADYWVIESNEFNEIPMSHIIPQITLNMIKDKNYIRFQIDDKSKHSGF